MLSGPGIQNDIPLNLGTSSVSNLTLPSKPHPLILPCLSKKELVISLTKNVINYILVSMLMAMDVVVSALGEIALTDPSSAIGTEQRRHIRDLDSQCGLDVARQLGVVPVASHVGLDSPSVVPRAVSIQGDVSRGVTARAPVHSGAAGEQIAHLGRQAAGGQQSVDLGIRGILEAVGRQDLRLQERTLLGIGAREVAVAASQDFCAGGSTAKGQGVVAPEGQATALVVRSAHHHCVRVLVDPLADIAHDLVVHERVEQVSSRV